MFQITIKEYKKDNGKDNRNFYRLSQADQLKLAREEREARRKKQGLL